MGQIEKKHRVTLTDEGRIDLVIQKMTGSPRSVIRGMFSNSCVTVDGEMCSDAGMIVEADRLVVLRYDPKMRYKEKSGNHESRIFTILHEDEHLIVVDKSAGYLTVPTDNREKNTLVSALYAYVNKGRAKGRLLGIVHRLDRDTSGVLVFGKTPDVTEQLKRQFIARKPEREYVAIVAGTLPEDSGKIESFLATDNSLNQYSTEDEEEGKLAITHFMVTRRLYRATALSVHLETGRRNQIRVHFAEKGHPILGDQRYEPELARHQYWPHKRLALHAASLGFTHPETQQAMNFKAPLPKEFMRFFAQSVDKSVEKEWVPPVTKVPVGVKASIVVRESTPARHSKKNPHARKPLGAKKPPKRTI